MCLQLNDKEYLFVFDSTKLQDREAAGYVRALSHKINERDVSKDMFTETQLVAVKNMLGIDLIELIDSDTNEKNLNQDEILKVLKNNPNLLRTPFILSRSKCFLIDSPLNLIKEQF